jgi:CheY-like chemotaxis protein
MQPKPRPLGVLVIDDDPPHRAALPTLLRLEGFELRQAANAHAALAPLADGDIDCAMVGLRRRRPGGEETGRLLRGQAGAALLAHGRRGRGPPPEGFEGVLPKPLSPEDLRSRLAEMRAGLPLVRLAGQSAVPCTS